MASLRVTPHILDYKGQFLSYLMHLFQNLSQEVTFDLNENKPIDSWSILQKKKKHFLDIKDICGKIKLKYTVTGKYYEDTLCDMYPIF